MSEYIDKNKALEALNDKYYKISGYSAAYYAGYQHAFDDLRKIGCEDVTPVIHARWILKMRTVQGDRFACSNCGRIIETGLYAKLEDFPYCHCGAKMDLEEDK